MQHRLMTLLFVAACAGPTTRPHAAQGTRGAAPSQLVVCGTEELFILDVSAATPQKVWSWRAADRPELPVSMRQKFKTIAECKPTDGGARILVAASSNGAAVVERETGGDRFGTRSPRSTLGQNVSTSPATQHHAFLRSFITRTTAHRYRGA